MCVCNLQTKKTDTNSRGIFFQKKKKTSQTRRKNGVCPTAIINSVVALLMWAIAKNEKEMTRRKKKRNQQHQLQACTGSNPAGSEEHRDVNPKILYTILLAGLKIRRVMCSAVEIPVWQYQKKICLKHHGKNNKSVITGRNLLSPLWGLDMEVHWSLVCPAEHVDTLPQSSK